MARNIQLEKTRGNLNGTLTSTIIEMYCSTESCKSFCIQEAGSAKPARTRANMSEENTEHLSSVYLYD